MFGSKAVSKQRTQNFDGVRFNVTKLNELDVRKQKQTKISKRVCSFGDLK